MTTDPTGAVFLSYRRTETRIQNTFSAVQTYVHMDGDSDRPYHPAALLRPAR